MRPYLLAAVVALSAAASAGTQAPGAQQPKVYSTDAEANDLFVRGQDRLAHADPRTGGSFANAREAIRLFEQALARDPRLALAHVQIARAWTVQGYSNPDAPPAAEIERQARAAVERSLEVDPELPEGHSMLAQIYYLTDYNWAGAEREYRWAIRRDPGNAAAHSGLAAFLATMGRFDEALEQAAIAEGIRHSPADTFNRARILYSMRRYDAAVEHCSRALVQQENQAFRFFLGLMLVAQGHPEQAIAEFEHAARQGDNAGASLGLAYGYATLGRSEDALRVIADVRATHAEDQVVAYRLAAVLLALGDRDGAIRELQRDYETRGSWMVQLKVDPVMDPLRSDPRFQELMRRLNFT